MLMYIEHGFFVHFEKKEEEYNGDNGDWVRYAIGFYFFSLRY